MHLPEHGSTISAVQVLLAFAAGLGMLCVQLSPASAFEPTMTCTEGGPYPCDSGESPKPVYWPRSCVSFHINRDGSAKVAGETAGLSDGLEAVVVDAFQRWDGVECSNLQLVYAGRTGNATAEVTEDDEKNMNLVVWRDDAWQTSASRMALAVTSVTFDTANGKIVDADVEFNTANHMFSTSTPPEPDHTDLLNTLVHEVGHFIGLDHTRVSEATMYASAADGETHKRTLEQDDIDGICHIYSGDDAEATCTSDSGSNNSTKGSDGDWNEDDSGCGCSSTDPSQPVAWLVVALVALGALRLRARSLS